MKGKKLSLTRPQNSLKKASRILNNTRVSKQCAWRFLERIKEQKSKTKLIEINDHPQTFCSMRYLTERKEPKNIGKSAIKTKPEYATNIPSGVAAALPVTFLAVSFTVAERFAKVSFTTVSAILSFDVLLFEKETGSPRVPCWPGPALFSFPMVEIHVAFSAEQLSPAYLFNRYVFYMTISSPGYFLFQVEYFICDIFKLLVFRSVNYL